MSSFWNFVFGAILVILWVVAGGYITQANIYLRPYKDTDDDFRRAYSFTFWAAFVTWFLVALFILLVILSVVGLVALFGSGVGEAGVAAEGTEGVEAEESLSTRGRNYASSPEGQSNITTGISWFTIAFLVFALILVGVTGVLAAVAASSMAKSPNFNTSVANLNTAYKDCIIAASLCLGAGSLLIIGIITYFIVGLQRQRKIEAEEKYQEKQRHVELSEIEQLRARSIHNKLEKQAEFKQEVELAREQAILRKISQSAT